MAFVSSDPLIEEKKNNLLNIVKKWLNMLKELWDQV